MTLSAAVPTNQEALEWVMAGYEGRPWTRMLETQPARLHRVGVWWRENQASTPVLVDVISDRVLIVNDLTLVLSDYGDITMILSSEARFAPPRCSTPRVDGTS